MILSLSLILLLVGERGGVDSKKFKFELSEISSFISYAAKTGMPSEIDKRTYADLLKKTTFSEKADILL